MIKRTIEISQAPAHIAVQRRQLLLQRDGQTISRIPCEDLGVVMVDQPATTFSHAALTTLADDGAVVVLCGADHLPLAMLLPLSRHTEVASRLQDQIRASRPVRKRLWQQLVRAKIRGQADNLERGSPARTQLEHLIGQVRSGDVTNVEARAARIYWKSWLLQPDAPVPVEAFRRQRDGAAPNGLLNYGYTVMRAAVARALVSAGLQPALGLHHSNRSNPFCLADDLVEPLRPLVDACVRELYFGGSTGVDRTSKQALLELLTLEVCTGGQTGPLMVGLHRYAASLAACLAREADSLEIPTPCSSTDIAVCGSS